MRLGDELNYAIYFENVPTATAPAQVVLITDTLDSNLDWSSFKIGEMAFGSQVAAQEGNAGEYHTQITIPDYRVGVNKNWWVDVTGQINYQTGAVSWVCRMLDPETGALPQDAAAGFLPPDDASGRGEGHVTFSVKPKATTALGTVITNTASIVFDTNAAIATNEVRNTINTVADVGLAQIAPKRRSSRRKIRLLARPSIFAVRPVRRMSSRPMV